MTAFGLADFKDDTQEERSSVDLVLPDHCPRANSEPGSCEESGTTDAKVKVPLVFLDLLSGTWTEEQKVQNSPTGKRKRSEESANLELSSPEPEPEMLSQEPSDEVNSAGRTEAPATDCSGEARPQSTPPLTSRACRVISHKDHQLPSGKPATAPKEGMLPGAQ